MGRRERRERVHGPYRNRDGWRIVVVGPGGERTNRCYATEGEAREVVDKARRALKQRVNLVINLALQDLVASRAARPLPIAIYDEAFEGLDRTGVEAAVRVLAEAARSKDLVLVITHQAHLKDMFTQELHVVREGGTSRVEARS